jgi:hypothetical protein
MHTIAQSYRSLSFLFTINWDRLVTTAVIIGSLYVSTFIILS